MTTNDPIQRVRIYLSEHDSHEGQPLYLAVLDRLRREGATGATALRGVAGFGASHRLRVAAAIDSSRVPVVIEWIDRVERIGKVLPLVDPLLGNAMVTIEAVHIYRAVLRAGGPLGAQAVGESMLRDPLCVPADARLAETLYRAAQRGQTVIPVVDAGRLVGVVDDAVLRRNGLPNPALLATLAADQQRAALVAVGARIVGEAIDGEPRTTYVESSVPQAVGTLMEWGIDTLPVIDHQGQCSGLFGVAQVLRVALDRQAGDGRVRDAERPPAVQMIMQQTFPAVAADTPLRELLARLIAAPAQFVAVLDAGQLVGVLTTAQAALLLPEDQRDSWIDLLARGETLLPPTMAADDARLARAVAQPTVAPIVSDAPRALAIQRLLDEGREWLLVVDAGQIVCGVVTRRGIMRALAQESVG